MKLRKFLFNGIMVLSVFLVSQCNFAPKYKAPDTQTPDVFRSAFEEGKSIANYQWWELFNDRVLQDLIKESLEKNLDLQIAVSKVAQSRAALGIATGDLMPTVGAGAGGGRRGISAPGDMPNSNFNNYAVGGALTWEIDVWGRLRNLRESERRNLLATDYMRKATIITLVSDVARSYLELRQLDMQYDIAKNGREIREKSYELALKRKEAGLSSMIDLSQAEAERRGIQAEISQLEAEITRKENAISVLLGKPPSNIPRGRDLTEQVFPPQVPPGIPSEILTRRPDIMAMEEQLQAAGARVGAARADFLPKIQLTVIGGSASDTLSNIATAGAYSAGASAATTIFDGGKKIYQLKLSKEEQKEMVLRYQKTVFQAFREVDDSLATQKKLEEARNALIKKVSAARKVRQLAEERYKVGQSNYLEVLDGQRTELSAELELAEIWAGHLVSVIQLYKALGGGWSPELEEKLTAAEKAKEEALKKEVASKKKK